jgi:putative inorganic carbon (HCO3(-)) transporter
MPETRTPIREPFTASDRHRAAFEAGAAGSSGGQGAGFEAAAGGPPPGAASAPPRGATSAPPLDPPPPGVAAAAALDPSPPRRHEPAPPSVLEAARRHPRLVAGALLVALAAALAFALTRPTVYHATAQMRVGGFDVSVPGAASGYATASVALAVSYSYSVDEPAVVNAVARQLHMPRYRVLDAVSASALPERPVFRIRAQASTADRAIALANATAQQLARRRIGVTSAAERARRLRAYQRAAGRLAALRAEQHTRQAAYQEQQSVDAARALARSEAAVAAQQIALDARREAFAAGAQSTTSTPGAELIAPARRAADDARATLQLYLIVALAAGLAAGLVVALGVAVLAWHARPALTISAGIVLLCCSGSWDRLGLPGAVAPDRLLLLLGAAAALLGAPAAARAAGPGGRRLRPALGIEHALLAAAIACALASALAAGTLGSGAFRLLDRYGVMAIVVALAAPLAFATERDRRTLLLALTGLGAYLGLTAVFEIAGPHALVFPRYIADLTYGIHPGRARGPFVEAAINGFALFACGAAALVLAADLRPRTAARWKQTLPWGVAALCALGLVLTLQRTIWLGASAALVVVLLSRRELRPKLLPAAAAAALLVVAALAIVPGLADRAGERRIAQRSVWDRVNLDHAAVAMVRARPLTGFGWDRFTATSTPYFWQDDEVPLTAGDIIPHNALLANAAELGLPAALLWLGGIVAAIGAALRAPRLRAADPWRDALLGLAVLALALALFTPLLAPWPLVVLLTWAGALRAQGSHPLAVRAWGAAR